MSRPRAVIAGGGPVGMALAAALGGFDVRVIESAPARSAPWPEDYDVRVFAVSPGTPGFVNPAPWIRAADARAAARPSRP